MNTKNTMESLRKRLDAIASTGAVKEGAISDLGEGESVHFYPDEAYGTLSEWFGDARKLSIELGFLTIASDLDSVLSAWTNLTPYEAAESLCLMDFAVYETVQQIRRREDDDEGPVFGFVEDGEPEEYADPIDARYRFHSMLKEFQQIVKHAEGLPSGSSVEMMEKEYWTREELAEFIGVKPKRVTQIISEYRREHGGEDPIWVRRLAGRQRGFHVKVATYKSQMNAGKAPRSKRRR
jgi:hypothetical protein